MPLAFGFPDMFRFFESIVDPYTPAPPSDAPPRRLWPFLRAWSQPFRRLFLVTAAMSVVVAAIEVWLIAYLGRLVDILAAAGPERLWAEYGAELLAVALFVVLLRPAAHGLHVLLLNNGIMPSYGTLIRWRAHSQVLRQSIGWFENDFAGRVANRITQTPMAAGDAIFQVFDAVAFSIAYMVGAAVLLSNADPRLLIPLAIWLALYILLVRWTVQRVGPASQASSDARSEVTGRVVDSYSNIHSVKLFANQAQELAYAKEAVDRTFTTVAREMRVYTTMDIALFVLNGLFMVSVTGWAILLWSAGGASLGIVAAATALVLRLNAMTGWIIWALTQFFRSLGIVAEGLQTIAQPIALTDAKGAPDLQVREGGIRFENVTHHYGRGRDGLDSVTITVRPGEKVGLVGRSGAGKSTLVKLLLRFYDPEGGRILIDGQDVTRVTQDSLRRAIGMVQQDTSLLHRSVRDNIGYGRSGASEAEIRAAAERAEALEFIATLQDPAGRRGFDAHVGERGVKLSGGQRQRIALARVILKDAPILVLDEATSALDSEVEAAIQSTLYGMMQG
jgi:ATP-binding cassette subfamily B multidrug efflux pump